MIQGYLAAHLERYKIKTKKDFIIEKYVKINNNEYNEYKSKKKRVVKFKDPKLIVFLIQIF